ncbi:MAG: ABC transporter permease [Acidobacteria bacterium]|nr:ABC transporter permease [Acidobacteriota bacterium]
MKADGFWSDLRHACRAVAGMPMLSAVIVGSLAVGIGVNTAVFSWVQALALQPLPGVASAADLHQIEARTETGGRPGSSWPEYEDLRDALRSTADLVAFRMVPLNVGEAARNERAYGLLVSDNYFSVLGLAPAAGRFPTPKEMSRGVGADVVVVSHDFWQAKLGGARDVVGQTLRANDRALTVIGVAPAGFQGTIMGLQFDLWVPAALAPALLAGSTELDDRATRGYSILARLPSSASVAEATTRATRTMEALARRFPESNAAVGAEVLPFWRAFRGPQNMLLQGVGVLQGVMLLLLLAVCGNTANLLLARANTRQREIGVRLSIGSSPWRVVRLLLAETLVLAVAAAVLGAVIAVWGTEAMRAVPLSGLAVPVRFQTSVDEGTLAFAAVLAVASTLACGLVPALSLARIDPIRALRGGGTGSTRGLLRRLLMASEVGLALVVLLVAGLFYRSFQDTRELDPGFRKEGVLLAAYDLGAGNRTADEVRHFTGRLLEAARRLPGAQAAAIAASVPLDIHGLPQRSFALEGRARTDGARDRALSNIVTPGYFETMGIPLVEGRDFADLADSTEAPQVVVNQAFVRRYLPDGAAIGRRLESGDRTYVVIGVARDSLYDAFGEPESPALYFSYRDRPLAQGELHLRATPGTEAALAPAARRAARELDAALPLFNARTLEDHVETNLLLRRIPARMFVVLGPLLLLLAAIGIYAVVAHAVAQRTTEIGVRLALGATTGTVVGQIVRESLKTIGVGGVAGWLAVYGFYIHLVRGTPIAWSVFAGVPAALLLVAAVSCWLPARRASRVDPVVALRRE